MGDLVNKLSTYHIFNYLLPGILFAVIADQITNYTFVQQDIVIGVFVYYFIGLVISRLGSIIIEPILKRTNFVEFAKYSDFLKASKADEKIETLSETNNMYRGFSATFVALIVLKSFQLTEIKYPVLDGKGTYILIVLLLILFLFSYRKQTNYITQRINAHSNYEHN